MLFLHLVWVSLHGDVLTVLIVVVFISSSCFFTKKGYLISFGIGAAIVTLGLWVLRFGNNYWYYHGNFQLAYQALPSLHLRVMWCAGGTSGLLWSTGNFFSLISVYYLGEGVGYAVCQAGILGALLNKRIHQRVSTINEHTERRNMCCVVVKRHRI